jgi:histidinol dehydrogenase
MPVRLKTTDPDFSASFAALLDTKREASADVDAAVRAIVGEVIERGDDALIELSKKFDRIDLAKTGLRISQEEIDAGKFPAKRCKRSSSRKNASSGITAARCRKISVTVMRSASSSAIAGRRSTPSAFTCRAVPPPILRPC